MNKYEEISPRAAKWLLPDGSTTDALPIRLVSGEGGGSENSKIIIREAVPDAAEGNIGDICVTPEGIYIKKMVETEAGLTLSCGNEAFNGFWRDMGVNETVSVTGGDPQGTRYYQHESGNYFLCWNTACGGYWWINTHPEHDADYAAAWSYAEEPGSMPPYYGWSGAVSGFMSWTEVEATPPQAKWEPYFNFKGEGGQPYYKNSRLMKHSEGIVRAYGNNGLFLYTNTDYWNGGLNLYGFLNLAGSANMARINEYNQLFVGESEYGAFSALNPMEVLNTDLFRNFRINLLGPAVSFAFTGSLPESNCPTTLKVWLIPNPEAAGSPKHTVTWPSNISWVCADAHKHIGAKGQPDAPVLVELTTFDNGETWIGRAYNVVNPN